MGVGINTRPPVCSREGKFLLFVVIEGIDGSGKSTLAKSLVGYYNSKGIEAIYTREPGGCKESEVIREIIMSKEYDIATTTLLMGAARNINYEEVIKPNEDKLIICDRYTYSTIAYQGFAEHRSEGYRNADSYVGSLAEITEPIKPDLVIILDISPTKALERIKENGRDTNRFDTKGFKYYEDVRDGYMYCLERFGGVLLNADTTPEVLLSCAIEEIDEALSLWSL